MRAATIYDLVAPLYERVLTPLHEIGVSRAVERVLGGWPKNVLEVGTGPGRATALLSGDGRRVIGVDVAPRMLRLARAHLAAEGSRAELVRASVLRLPYRNATFDAVLTTYLLDVLADAELPGALREMVRVLSPGGRLVLGTMNLPKGLIEQGWMMVYHAMPEIVGHSRPANPFPHLANLPLRVIREETVKGWVGMRVITMVKTG